MKNDIREAYAKTFANIELNGKRWKDRVWVKVYSDKREGELTLESDKVSITVPLSEVEAQIEKVKRWVNT